MDERVSRGRGACRPAGWIGAMVAAGLVSLAHAGPEWEEDSDAGAFPTPGTAQTVGKVGGGPLAAIRGRLGGLSPAGPGDFQDVFEIFIADPAAFNASIDFPDSPGFDTQLFLFQFDGFGLLANDDVVPGGGVPPGASELRPVATDGSGAIISSPGIYYLAITGSDSDPLVTGLDIFDMPPGSTEISGPDGPGGSLGPPDLWSEDGQTGAYRIQIQGCQLIPLELPCPGDLNMDQVVSFEDLLILLASWSDGCSNCPADLDGDFDVDFNDLIILLANWGPC